MSDPRAASTYVTVRCRVNDLERDATVPARTTVADLLRDHFGLTGTHLGCEHGVCGACTILLDGTTVRSCILYAGQVHGRTLRTVESLADEHGLNRLQEAFRQQHALQCGFCTPGFLLAVAELLAEVPHPTESQVREALSGNLCRCTGYDALVAVAQSVTGNAR